MIGVVVVAHGKLAHELMSTAELILGPQENFTAVSLHADWEVDEARKALKNAIAKVDQGDRVCGNSKRACRFPKIAGLFRHNSPS